MYCPTVSRSIIAKSIGQVLFDQQCLHVQELSASSISGLALPEQRLCATCFVIRYEMKATQILDNLIARADGSAALQRRNPKPSETSGLAIILLAIHSQLRSERWYRRVFTVVRHSQRTNFSH